MHLGVSSQERLFESMVVGEGARGLDFVDGFPVLSELQLIAPDVPVRGSQKGCFLRAGEASRRLAGSGDGGLATSPSHLWIEGIP